MNNDLSGCEATQSTTTSGVIGDSTMEFLRETSQIIISISSLEQTVACPTSTEFIEVSWSGENTEENKINLGLN